MTRMTHVTAHIPARTASGLAYVNGKFYFHAWPEIFLGTWVAVEFDGKVKYGRLLKPGQTASDVAWDEKLREDALARLGWEVVRWTWADLFQPELLTQRVWAGFELGMRYL